MNKIKVDYLYSDGVDETEEESNPEYLSDAWREWVKNHTNTVTYNLSEFEEAFNREFISDLGYIVIEEIK